jgi:hypothetical protein
VFEWLFGGGKPTPRKFAELMSQALRAAGEKGSIEFDEANFKLALPGGEFFFLGNAFAEYCAAPRAQRSQVLARFVRTFAERSDFPTSFDEAAPNLLPRIRERPYFDFTRLQLELQGLTPGDARPYELVGEHLAESLVFDRPTSIAEIPPSTLETWGTAYYLARERALENLEARSTEPFERVAPGVFVSPWHDNHDPSRILLLEKVRELPLEGDPVALPVHRDLLVLAGSEDVGGLESVARLLDTQREAPRLMTLVPVRLEGDEWTTWLPQGSSPGEKRLRRLALESALRDAAEQKRLLDKLHERRGQDVFVASLTGIEPANGGEAWSYTVWAEDVLALLPRADFVVFVRAAEGRKKPETIRVPWESAREIAGDLMALVPEMWPERFRVEEFPGEAELDALRASARPA